MAKLLISPANRDWHAACNVLADTGHRPPAEDQMMTNPSLFAREDTMLGVCEGLGQELGVPPLLFRVAFAVGLFWNPLAMVVAYLALGAALALFRWAFPLRVKEVAAPAGVGPAGDNDDAALPETLAA